MKTDYINPTEADELILSLPQEYRTIVRLAAESGFRIGDICTARWEDYDRDERTLTLKEDKTNKIRTAAVTDRMYLDLALQRLRVPEKERYIFPGRDPGTHVNRCTVWRWVTRTWAWLHSDDERTISPHSLRKMYAVRLLASGKSLGYIRRDLNHDRIDTTMLYAFADHIDDAMSDDDCKIKLPSDRV